MLNEAFRNYSQKQKEENNLTENITPENQKNNEANNEEADDLTVALLNEKNRGFFENMSDKAKDMVSGLYSKLNADKKDPFLGFNTLDGKLDISGTQFLADFYEKRAAKRKDKLDEIDINLKTLESTRTKIENTVQGLKNKKIPGSASLEIELKKIEKESMKLLGKRDKIQTKFEAHDNKKKNYINKRDQVADRLIGRYDERLEPMEKELEVLQGEKSKTDLLFASLELRHKNEAEELDVFKKQRDELISDFISIGASERRIKNATSALDGIISNGEKKMREEKELLLARKNRIDEKIEKADKRANPYRDKREKFVRTKNLRPVEMNVEKRKKGESFSGREDIKSGTRENVNSGNAQERNYQEREKEKFKDFQTADNYLKTWNLYVDEIEGGDPKKKIDLDDFCKESSIPKNYQMGIKDFVKVFKQYCEYRKKTVPENLEVLLAEFTEMASSLEAEKDLKAKNTAEQVPQEDIDTEDPDEKTETVSSEVEEEKTDEDSAEKLSQTRKSHEEVQKERAEKMDAKMKEDFPDEESEK